MTDTHSRLINLAAVARLLAGALLERHVDARDRGEADLSAVALHLAGQLAQLRDELEVRA